jgi:hypothetical protein
VLKLQVYRTECNDEPSQLVFRDSSMDLYVWRHGGEVCGFELDYRMDGGEQALRWTTEEGVALFRIACNGGTPTLTEISYDVKCIDVLRREFAARAALIDGDVRQCVLAWLDPSRIPGVIASRMHQMTL